MHGLQRIGRLLTIAVLLGGCSLAAVTRPSPLTAQEDFARRLRWLDIPGAAQHLAPEYRDAFSRSLAGLTGLHITDVRLAGDVVVDPDHVDNTLEIDYYLLPSVLVKTRHLQLHWAYIDLGRWQAGYWQIVGPFPEFP